MSLKQNQYEITLVEFIKWMMFFEQGGYDRVKLWALIDTTHPGVSIPKGFDTHYINFVFYGADMNVVTDAFGFSAYLGFKGIKQRVIIPWASIVNTSMEGQGIPEGVRIPHIEGISKPLPDAQTPTEDKQTDNVIRVDFKAKKVIS